MFSKTDGKAMNRNVCDWIKDGTLHKANEQDYGKKDGPMIFRATDNWNCQEILASL